MNSRTAEKHSSERATHAWFAVAAPGLELLLERELRGLASIAGLTSVERVAGGVSFSGTLLAGYAVNVVSRLATRVLLRLGDAKAREFAVLRKKLSALPFDSVLDAGTPVRVEVTTRHCRLFHTKAVAEAVELAIGDRLRVPVVRAPALPSPRRGSRKIGGPQLGDDVEGAGVDEPEASADLSFGLTDFARVLVRGQDDVFTVSIDASGLLLHRRGGRPWAGAAPLRETLAAAVLAHADYTGEEPLIDAMCGAGTLALEAAQIGLGRLAGERRAFALERFPCAQGLDFTAERVRLGHALARRDAAPVLGFDRDARMVALARHNAEQSGVAEHVRFAQFDLHGATPPVAHGLVVLNPPYGKRLGRGEDTKARYRRIGHALRGRFAGFRVAILVPPGVPQGVLGLRVSKRVMLSNGGLRISLVIGTPQP